MSALIAVPALSPMAHRFATVLGPAFEVIEDRGLVTVAHDGRWMVRVASDHLNDDLIAYHARELPRTVAAVLPNLAADPLASYTPCCPYDCDHPIPQPAARGPFRVRVSVGAARGMPAWTDVRECPDEADAVLFLRNWIEDETRYRGSEVVGPDGLMRLSAGRLVMAYRCEECGDSGRVLDSHGDDGRLVACECAAGAKWERVGNRFWRL